MDTLKDDCRCGNMPTSECTNCHNSTCDDCTVEDDTGDYCEECDLPD